MKVGHCYYTGKISHSHKKLKTLMWMALVKDWQQIDQGRFHQISVL